MCFSSWIYIGNCLRGRARIRKENKEEGRGNRWEKMRREKRREEKRREEKRREEKRREEKRREEKRREEKRREEKRRKTQTFEFRNGEFFPQVICTTKNIKTPAHLNQKEASAINQINPKTKPKPKPKPKQNQNQ